MSFKQTSFDKWPKTSQNDREHQPRLKIGGYILQLQKTRNPMVSRELYNLDLNYHNAMCLIIDLIDKLFSNGAKIYIWALSDRNWQHFLDSN